MHVIPVLQVKDRKIVGERMKAHVAAADTTPLLIFPEGTCVNNEYCVMFKRGAFDLDATVCPIAIKYNKIFVDAFWNSRRQSFTAHLVGLLLVVCLSIWARHNVVVTSRHSSVMNATPSIVTLGVTAGTMYTLLCCNCPWYIDICTLHSVKGRQGVATHLREKVAFVTEAQLYGTCLSESTSDGVQLKLMTSWAVVCDVYFLEPQTKGSDETAQQFAERVQKLIAQRANLHIAPWDGYLKYYNLGDKVSCAGSHTTIHNVVVTKMFGPAVSKPVCSAYLSASTELGLFDWLATDNMLQPFRHLCCELSLVEMMLGLLCSILT